MRRKQERRREKGGYTDIQKNIRIWPISLETAMSSNNFS